LPKFVSFLSNFAFDLFAFSVLIFSSCSEDSGHNPFSVTSNGKFPDIPEGIKMVDISGGSFEMGNHNNWDAPAHIVTVNSFKMSAHEITNAQYAEYLNETLAEGELIVTEEKVIAAKGEYSGRVYLEIEENWIVYSSGEFKVKPEDKQRWPVTKVTWHGASAFAAFYGLELPTEAEWEYAARGGQQLGYGTADGTLNYSLANFGLTVGHPTNVGSYPPNPFGLYDMSGNACEWCSDWYDPGYYRTSPCENPQGPQSSDNRVDRGGSWATSKGLNESAGRDYNGPNYRQNYLGFRVVAHLTDQLEFYRSSSAQLTKLFL